MPLCRHFVLGNGKFRCVISFRKDYRSPHITTYLPNPGNTEDTRNLALKDLDLPIAGDPDFIKSTESAFPGRHIKINLELPNKGPFSWELWVNEGDQLLFFKNSAGRNYSLKCDRDKATFRQALPFLGNPPAKFPQKHDCAIISMQDAELAAITNSLPALFSAVIREDGRFPAGAHNAYGGAWIRDGVMSAAGWAYADYPETEKLFEYLFLNVPPKEGQIEEYGMMIWGIYQYWCHSGNDAFVAKFADRLKEFVWKPFASLHNGLILSKVEGYWERAYLGEGYSFSQNCWAVHAVDCYLKMAEHFRWHDDFEMLNEKRNIVSHSLFDCRFKRDGYFAKRLLPDFSIQDSVTVERYLSMGIHPYQNEFARSEDLLKGHGLLNPDSQTSTAWLLGLLPADVPESIKTGHEIWKLWNQAWDFGGLERYNVTSDCDREVAGPWFLASFMMGRAYLLQNEYLRVSQIIEWGRKEFNGAGWSERISRSHNPADPNRYVHEILNWPAGEWLMMLYREGAGLYPTNDGLRISPHLPRKFAGLKIQYYRYRGFTYNISYVGAGFELRRINFNGRQLSSNLLPMENGDVEVLMKN
ncbi:MAG TPA: hypothetical protein DCZ94_06180 [Lentisphaeria bacterium]|nr:MAG: hypothetical protein A2X48_05585 [Lentisphaerae bacterium GWF2_49_21]HBC86524.1 hypothetical protein [Lentisphaeria bacterium]